MPKKKTAGWKVLLKEQLRLIAMAHLSKTPLNAGLGGSARMHEVVVVGGFFLFFSFLFL